MAWLAQGLLVCRVQANYAELPPEPAYGKPVTLQLLHRHGFQFAGFYVALEKGFYREAGFEVAFRERVAGMDSVEEVLAGRAQYGMAGSELLPRAAEGAPVVCLAAYFQQSPSVFFVRKDSLHKVSELKGKKMGFKGTPLPAVLDLLLRKQGLDRTNLIWVAGATLDDLVTGRVDAIHGYLSDQAYELGQRDVAFRLLKPRDYGLDFYSDCLFTTRSEAQAHPERVLAFVQASRKGWDYALEHPDEIIALIQAKYAPDADLGKLAYESTVIRALMMPDLIEPGHMLPARWTRMARQFREAGMIRADVDEARLVKEFLFDPPVPWWAGRRGRILAWSAGLGSLTLLFLLFTVFSLRRMVAGRTRDLESANRMLRRENEDRKKAGHLIAVQRDLAMVMTSRKSLEEATNALLEKLLMVPGVDVGGIYLLESEAGGLRLVAHRGLSESFVRQSSYVPAESERFRLVMEGRTVFMTEAGLSDHLKAERLKAVLVVPIRLENRILGSLNVASRTLSQFQDDQVAALETMGAQLGPIVEWLRALEALRESERNYRTLTEVASDAILITVGGIIVHANPQLAQLTGYDPAELIGMHAGLLPPPDERSRLEAIHKARQEGQPVPSQYESRLLHRSGRIIPVRFSVRLIEWKGRGACLVFCTDLTARKRLEEAVLKIGQWEKRRIGHDLHDSLGQQLTGISYLCKSLEEDLAEPLPKQSERAAWLGSLVRESIEQLRRTVRGLGPVRLEEGGLVGALSRVAVECEGLSGIVCRFENRLKSEPDDPVAIVHLYHVAQEAVNNAIKHGRAACVGLTLEGDRLQGVLTVEDDGRGFAAEAGPAGGAGMAIMRYRAELLGGALEIGSNSKGGVTVRCRYDILVARAEGRLHDEPGKEVDDAGGDV